MNGSLRWARRDDVVAAVYSRSPVMCRAAGLWVEWEDNTFDQMRRDLLSKGNLHGHVLVADEKLGREMSSWPALTNWQRNIYWSQPMEEMSKLERDDWNRMRWN